MEQKSLRVLDTNKTFFSKITSTITKILVPTRVGINSIMISMKRNNLLKAYYNYLAATEENDTEKKELMLKKYEDNYSLYLEAIDRYIMDSVYKKVKNNTASDFERMALITDDWTYHYNDRNQSINLSELKEKESDSKTIYFYKTDKGYEYTTPYYPILISNKINIDYYYEIYK